MSKEDIVEYVTKNGVKYPNPSSAAQAAFRAQVRQSPTPRPQVGRFGNIVGDTNPQDARDDGYRYP